MDSNVKELFDLVKNNGSRKDVARILDQYPSLLNVVDSKGCTLILSSCAHKNHRMASFLAERGAEMNTQDKSLRTALHYACAFGRLDFAQLLVSRGANLNIQEKNGWTAFHLACDTGSVPVATYLAEKGADINIQDINGYTALHYACAYNKTEIAVLLIEQGANVNISGIDGKTALQLSEGALQEQLRAVWLAREKALQNTSQLLQQARQKSDRFRASPIPSDPSPPGSPMKNSRYSTSISSSSHHSSSTGTTSEGKDGQSSASTSLYSSYNNNISSTPAASNDNSSSNHVNHNGYDKSNHNDVATAAGKLELDDASQGSKSLPKSSSSSGPATTATATTAPVVHPPRPTRRQSLMNPYADDVARNRKPVAAPAPAPVAPPPADLSPDPSEDKRYDTFVLVKKGSSADSIPPISSNTSMPPPAPVPPVPVPSTPVPTSTSLPPSIITSAPQLPPPAPTVLTSPYEKPRSPKAVVSRNNSSSSIQSPPRGRAADISRRSYGHHNSSHNGNFPSLKDKAFDHHNSNPELPPLPPNHFPISLASDTFSRPVVISRFELLRVTQNFSSEYFYELGNRNSFDSSSIRQSNSGNPMVMSPTSSNSLYRGSFNAEPVLVRRLTNHYSSGLTNFSQDGGSLPNHQSSTSLLQRFVKELNVLTSCHHAHILPLVCVCADPQSLSLVYPLADWGSLQDVLGSSSKRSVIPYDVRLRIASGICSALAYLHRPNEEGKPWVVVHRNIKPVKVLLSGSDGSFVRLAGLEYAMVLDQMDLDETGSINSFMCETEGPLPMTEGYVDPLYNETGELNVLSDIYSLGVVLLQLLTGASLAFDSSQRPPGLVARTKMQYKEGRGKLPEDEIHWPDQLRNKFATIVFQCLALSSTDRPSDCDQLQHAIDVLLVVEKKDDRFV